MDWMAQPEVTEASVSRQSGSGPIFRVRRHTDGACADACDFNRGPCLMSWRHPASTMPWDRRCQDGDIYQLTPTRESAFQ